MPTPWKLRVLSGYARREAKLQCLALVTTARKWAVWKPSYAVSFSVSELFSIRLGRARAYKMHLLVEMI